MSTPVAGPELPPALIAARKAKLASRKVDEEAGGQHRISHKASERDEQSDEDGDTGPMLPSDFGKLAQYATPSPRIAASVSPVKRAETVVERQAWMTEIPTASDWAKNLDTTKLKSRAFEVSRPGKPLPHTHEITQKTAQTTPNNNRESVERGETLYELHTQKRRRENKEIEDVSARPFDRERDINNGTSMKKRVNMVGVAGQSLQEKFA